MIRFDQFVVSVVEEHLNYEESRGKAVHERVTETIDRYVQWQKSQQTLKTLGTGDADAKQQCDAILGEMRAAQADLDTVSQDREKMNLLKGDTWPTPEAESRWNALAAQLKTTADALGQYKDLYTIKKEPTATSDVDMVVDITTQEMVKEASAGSAAAAPAAAGGNPSAGAAVQQISLESTPVTSTATPAPVAPKEDLPAPAHTAASG